MAQNEKIHNIKKILGLQHGAAITDLSQLRDGRVLIMADADSDGIHVKALLCINLKSGKGTPRTIGAIQPAIVASLLPSMKHSQPFQRRALQSRPL